MRKPDLQSISVKAWQININEKLQKAHTKEFGYPSTGIDTWLVNGAFHPFWSWWHIGVISLKDFPGMPPAHKKYPEAEYEFSIFALNPDPDPGRPKIPD